MPQFAINKSHFPQWIFNKFKGNSFLLANIVRGGDNMNPIEYAESKGWEKVNYTFIPVQGPVEEQNDVEPERILAHAVSTASAELTREEEGKAFFLSRMELMNIFISGREVAPTGPGIEVRIVMEHVRI
jgi:hypothetical protein